MLPVIADHRSIRNFQSKAIPCDVMEQMLRAATRASTVGTMQLYSIIVSESEEIKAALAPLHFNQPAATTAAALVTFCVDVARFSEWCKLREADPAYNNFAWFVNGAIDALLASENFALEAENNGLGICYLGTTTYTARDICRVLELPRGVVPITTVAVGYPVDTPELTARLPLAAVVHREKYEPYSPEKIDELYFDTENSEQTMRLLEINQAKNLAKIFTDKRYPRADNEKFSKEYLDVLREQGFLE